MPKSRLTVVERNAAVKASPVEDRTQLIRTISSHLNDRSPRVRETALEVARDQVLCELNDRIISLLLDKNDFVRQRAIECLGFFHEGRAIEVPSLYPLLQDSNDLVKVETLESLAQIGDKQALPLMVQRLGDEHYLVRSYAAISIAELGGKKFRKQIEKASKVEEVEKAKPWFARALLLGDWKQFSTLLELLSSNSPTARCSAANALNAFKWSSDQLELALSAVAHAERNFLTRSDQTTMQRVMKELLEDVSAPMH